MRNGSVEDHRERQKRKLASSRPSRRDAGIAQATTLTGFFLVAVVLALAFAAVAVGQ